MRFLRLVEIWLVNTGRLGFSRKRNASWFGGILRNVPVRCSRKHVMIELATVGARAFHPAVRQLASTLRQRPLCRRSTRAHWHIVVKAAAGAILAVA